LGTPWFVAGNRSIPDSPFFRRQHVSAFRSFLDVELEDVNIGSVTGWSVVRRNSGSLQVP